MWDIPRIGFHKCDKMPQNEFAEKQQGNWHIHKTDKKHSEYREDLKDDICPYCNKTLLDTFEIPANLHDFKEELTNERTN